MVEGLDISGMINNPLLSVMSFKQGGSAAFVSAYELENTIQAKHDYAKGVDVSIIGDEFIKNGADNYFPYHTLEAVKRSVIQKRAFKTISAVAAGSISFLDKDGNTVDSTRLDQLLEVYKSLGITNSNFIQPVTCSNYLHGGTPITLTYGSNGIAQTLSAIRARDFKTFRLSGAEMRDGYMFHDRHYYHRNWGYRAERKNKKTKVSRKSALDWIEWQNDIKKNFDKVCYIPAFDPELKLSEEVNRTQSYYLTADDGLSDYYPAPSWFSGSAFNYIRADFFLSCFDIDQIENGFHSPGIVKAYHKAYKNPESGEAKETFEQQKEMIEEKMKGAFNSGSFAVIPMGADGNAVSGSIEFVPTPTTANRELHTILSKRIQKNILSANGAIYSELFGIQNDNSSMSESSDKLINGLKILNQFTIKPLKSMLDDPQSGFLNVVNDILGIEERAKIIPNLSAFLNIAPDLSKHFLHPEQWFAMYKDFGLEPPTEEQIASKLIPAFREGSSQVNVNLGNG